MPLGVQALLPFLALLVAAAVVHRRPRRAANGWVAAGATTVAAAIALVELVRLAPGERVDVPYLTTFPYADLAIRLDALSLSFATMTLATAALLMLARLRMPGDRRDPWVSWLLTTVAVLAVIMAHNLLLVYIALQLLTLAWSGTLDEGAPRRRALRLAIQVADLGLLLAAASAIQSVGTSAFSGVPSDTFGPAAFLLALLPVLVRMAALAWPTRGSIAPVAFEPAVAWAAPAGYLMVRLVALMGGRLPGRPLEAVIFGGALLLGAAAAIRAFWERSGPRLTAYLLPAQAAVALALIASSSPLPLVASIWVWLQLIPLAGLCSVRLRRNSLAGAVALVFLSMLPGSAAFIGLWIGGVGLIANGFAVALLPVGAVVLLAAVAALARVEKVDRVSFDVPTAWAVALILLAAFPFLLLGPVVDPAAQAVRPVPAGTVLMSPLGFIAGGTPWPALLAAVLALGVLAVLVLTGLSRVPHMPASFRLALRYPAAPRRFAISPRWSTRALWSAFIVVVALAVLRP